ncbi:MAG: riboflavin synthase [Dehalococcoidia bacterium]
MFTGIVEEVGIVRSLQEGKLTVLSTEVLKGTSPGDSIAVNGACLTVTAIDGNAFSVDIMPATERCTNLGSLRPGDGVNLERALSANGRFEGHFVQGHVDGTGRISSVSPEEQALLMKVAPPADIIRYLVEKGYVGVDGVSLTIARCDANSFTVSLVEYTQKHTTLGHRRPGDVVNLEVDIIAKYLEKMKGESRPGVSLEFLAEHGFLAV